MFTKEELKEIKDFIGSSSLDSKIYIGTDSTRLRKSKVRYATVVVIHFDGCRGAKIFGYTDIEKAIKEKANRPFNRMMSETMKSAELYLELADVIGSRYNEVHLDINQDAMHGSSVALSSAVGYIQGVCGVIPVTKPAESSFAASCVADKWCRQ